ncbi:MAG: hypothetical protein Q4C71_02355 [Microbacteriaceae bacterium]|nr:hypothetical protein [Microbacteriaceae bacterium]
MATVEDEDQISYVSWHPPEQGEGLGVNILPDKLPAHLQGKMHASFQPLAAQQKHARLQKRLSWTILLSILGMVVLGGLLTFQLNAGQRGEQHEFISQQLAQHHPGCGLVQAEIESSAREMSEYVGGSRRNSNKHRGRYVVLCKNSGKINPGDFVAQRLDQERVPVLQANRAKVRINARGVPVTPDASLITVLGKNDRDGREAKISDYPYTHAPDLQEKLEADFERPENHQQPPLLPFVIAALVANAVLLIVAIVLFFWLRRRPASSAV